MNITSLNLFSGDIGKNTGITLDSGWSSSINATVIPENATNKTVTWTSSNTSVVEIIEGGAPRMPYLHLRGKGVTTIVAKAGDKTTACTIYVLDIKMNTGNTEMIVGEEITLNTTTNPGGQSVNWSCSNTSRATVEGTYGQGKVIAKAPGTLTINATYQGETVSCNITVKPLQGK